MKPLKGFFKTFSRARQGNAAIEFALIFPTLVVITLLIFDLGRALFVYTTVTNAAAEGARYAAIHAQSNVFVKTEAEILDYIEERGAGLAVDNLTITITYDPNIAFTGSEVEVQVAYALELFLSGVFEGIIDADPTLTLTGVSTMHVL